MTEIRRKDRRMGCEEAWRVVEECPYAVLSMIGEDGSPYGVPVHIVREGSAVYFHCAPEGRKTDCLRRWPRVCLTCVTDVRVVPERFTTKYRSAVAWGTAREITGEEQKRHLLALLSHRYAPEMDDAAETKIRSALSRTAVWEIAVEEITGKGHI